MTSRKILYVFLLLIVSWSVNNYRFCLASGLDSAYRPGCLLVLTKNNYRPTLTSLIYQQGFAKISTFREWKIEALAEKYKYAAGDAKTTGSDFLDNIYIVSFPDTVDVPRAMTYMGSHPDIIAIEPDYRLKLFSQPEDPLFEYQWYLNNTGQQFYAIDRIPGLNNDTLFLKTGLAGEDINLAPIYDNPPADSVPVIIAIIDTGVDVDHPDLASNIYHNPGEIPDNAVDDDHNGLVDDWAGWDFSGDTLKVANFSADNDVSDSVGHGTHLAGIVAAVENNIGVAGFPAKINILPLKIFPNGFVSLSALAIIYAADRGARVMNMSWGSPFESSILREAIEYARQRGCLMVAAAGNSGSSQRYWPAAFEATFTVGATDADGFLTYFTTYGPQIDIVAPGDNILSLRAKGSDMYAPEEPNVRIIDDYYFLADGTSMAAPVVAGAAGLLMSYNPGVDASNVAEALRQSAHDLVDPFDRGDNLPGYDTLSGWGRLNVSAAYDLLQAPGIHISSPEENAILGGEIVVTAAPTGGYAGAAYLYLGEGKSPQEWSLLYQTNEYIPNDTFYLWNTQGFNGYYQLRLVSDFGEYRRSLRIVNENIAVISSPVEGEAVKYLLPICGSAYGLEFDSLTIGISHNPPSGYFTIYSTTELIFNDLLFEWSVASINEGDYSILLSVFLSSGVIADTVGIHVESLMREGFPVKPSGYAAFSPGTADIDGDNRKEIILATQNGLFAYNDDGTLLDGFPVLTDHDIRTIPAFDDIDGDGLVDIVILGREILGCFNYLGQALPGWPREASSDLTFYTYPVPVLTELYDSGDSVIIYMTPRGEVHAFRYNGQSYFYSLEGLFTALDPNLFDTSGFAGLAAPYLTASDLDGDGHNEIIGAYSTSDVSAGTFIWDGRNGLPAFDNITPLVKAARLTFGGAMADIDNDGDLDIIVAGLDTNRVATIWVTDDGAQDIPGWPVQMDYVSDWIGTAPVCADIDNDGSKEVAIAFYGLDGGFDAGRIYAYCSDGAPYKENFSQDSGLLTTTSTSLAHIIVADIDGNGIPNLLSRGGYIFPGTGYERLFAWEPSGDLTPGFPIVTSTPLNEILSTPLTPVVDDLDGDGFVEVVMCGDAGDLFVWNMDAEYRPDLMKWPRFRGDEKNSGINHHIYMPTGVVDNQTVLPYRFAISEIYPNPFNPATTISFSIDRRTEVKLEVFNILGQRVTELLSGEYEAGLYEIVWNGTDINDNEVASGIYLARLTGEGESRTKKMILVR